MSGNVGLHEYSGPAGTPNDFVPNGRYDLESMVNPDVKYAKLWTKDDIKPKVSNVSFPL